MHNPPPEPRAGVRKRRILPVDDEDFVREAGRAMLQLLGYDVETAASGEEALAIVRLPGTAFDLAVIDLNMPDMDGAACFRALRKTRPALRTMLTSGGGMNATVEALLDECLLGLIEKPFTLQSLREAADRAWGAPIGESPKAR